MEADVFFFDLFPHVDVDNRPSRVLPSLAGCQRVRWGWD